MLLTNDCLQVRQKADGNGIPAYHHCATGLCDDVGRRPATPECGDKPPTQLLRGHVVGWGFPTTYVERPYSRQENEQRRRRLAKSSELSYRLLPAQYVPNAENNEDGTSDNSGQTARRILTGNLDGRTWGQ